MISLSDPAWLGFLAAFGLCYSLFGYIITRVVVMVLAMFWGFQQGALIADYYLQVDVSALHIAISVITALVLSLSSLFAFWLLAFVIGCFFGYQFALLAFDSSLISVFMFSVATGIVFAVLERWLVISLSALMGAWILLTAIAMLTGIIELPADILGISDISSIGTVENLLRQQLNSPVPIRVLVFLALALVTFVGFTVQIYLDSTDELKWLK